MDILLLARGVDPLNTGISEQGPEVVSVSRCLGFPSPSSRAMPPRLNRRWARCVASPSREAEGARASCSGKLSQMRGEGTLNRLSLVRCILQATRFFSGCYELSLTAYHTCKLKWQLSIGYVAASTLFSPRTVSVGTSQPDAKE